MTTPLRLGIAGLGTVGVGVIKILHQKANLLAERTGRPIEIVAVSARSKGKDRGVSLDGYAWEDDPVALAKRDDIDVFVELMGGDSGPAKDATEAALASGKDVVTANKALLAHHGQNLAEIAEASNHVIRFEAAVAGGIPVIKALTEGLAGNDITRVMGVMNGTCNYILTRMENAGLTYEEAFAEADGLGYLEADPNLDVGGIDAGHKLALLAAIAYGTQPDFDAVELEGIGSITIEDIRQAADMGYKIKLLGVAQMTGRGLEQRMSPCLVPATSPLGQLEGGTNMVVLEGDHVGQIVLRGAGAGEGPTASAVLGDIMDIARGIRISTFGQPAAGLTKARAARAAIAAPYYLRMELHDKPGALAKIATQLGEAGISIDRMRQYGHNAGAAPVLIVTHKTTRNAVEDALKGFDRTGVVATKPVVIRIETVE
ncbi:homoserine dehydrogenase [Aestuariibius sp. HNIBRBA575]|uniref:homoserine dehydrogenase n=1 Tax=Aestuariibius sp. HNIBRBA575 TaxID=3233343 RepID=UPI0034A390A8